MTRPRISLLLITLTLSLAGCQSDSGGGGGASSARAGSSGGDADVQSTLSKVVDQHCQGLLKHDWDSLERLWSDDFTFVNPRGELLSKAQRLQNLRTGATAFKSIDVSEQRHRTLGPDAAVTTNRVRIVGQYSGQEGSGDYRVTWVWGRPRGNWQLVALHMTRVDQA